VTLDELREAAGALLGQPVFVRWRPRRGDWPWFTLLGHADDDGGVVYLRGRDAPNGVRHRGNSFWARLADVAEMAAGDGPPGAEPGVPVP